MCMFSIAKKMRLVSDCQNEVFSQTRMHNMQKVKTSDEVNASFSKSQFHFVINFESNTFELNFTLVLAEKEEN